MYLYLQSGVDALVLSDHNLDGLGSAEHLDTNCHPLEVIDLGFDPQFCILLTRRGRDFLGSITPSGTLALDFFGRSNKTLKLLA
jgi:hypothetical protein